jgi:hypothetical protein
VSDDALKHRTATGFQGPTTGEVARSGADLYAIVEHPAFRVGFLDAQAGRPLDHDKIVERVIAATPPNAWKRMRLAPDALRTPKGVELAQYRYEEGRLLVIQEGVRCRKWGHPDFPPEAVRHYIAKRVMAAPPAIEMFSIAQMRPEGLPLFRGQTS